MILADESMNGPDKVVPAMKRIDNERYTCTFCLCMWAMLDSYESLLYLGFLPRWYDGQQKDWD
jgi:hypothetical protein